MAVIVLWLVLLVVAEITQVRILVTAEAVGLYYGNGRLTFFHVLYNNQSSNYSFNIFIPHLHRQRDSILIIGIIIVFDNVMTNGN